MARSVARLLSDLNEWEQKYGPLGGGKGTRLGEASTRITQLKAQLSELGAEVCWNGSEYVLVSKDGNT